MTREEAKEFIAQSVKSDVDMAKVADAIKALEQEPTTKIEESNFSQEQYKSDLQSAYDCGYQQAKNALAVEEHKGEVMDFPNTFDEFAKDYGFKDKDEVYTNGSELISVFRVKQWLEHISTTKNDLTVDCISREQAKVAIRDKFKDLPSRVEINTILNELPSVIPQPCEDAVSRQEVLDLIADYDLSMGQVVRGIHALPSVTPQEPRWIPCSEKLPKAEYGESDSVLVCFENETQDVLYFDGSNWRYPTGETYISVNPNNDWHNKVVAWMSLPKSYSEVEE